MLFGPVGAALGTLVVDMAALLVLTGLAAVLLRRERTISRAEGGLALLLYALFITVTVVKG